MDLPEENPAIRDLLHQLAADLRGLPMAFVGRIASSNAG